MFPSVGRLDDSLETHYRVRSVSLICGPEDHEVQYDPRLSSPIYSVMPVCLLYLLCDTLFHLGMME